MIGDERIRLEEPRFAEHDTVQQVARVDSNCLHVRAAIYAGIRCTSEPVGSRPKLEYPDVGSATNASTNVSTTAMTVMETGNATHTKRAGFLMNESDVHPKPRRRRRYSFHLSKIKSTVPNLPGRGFTGDVHDARLLADIAKFDLSDGKPYIPTHRGLT